MTMDIYENPQLKSYLMMKNGMLCLLGLGIRQGCPLPPLVFNTVLGIPGQLGKKRSKRHPFTDDVTLCMENTEESTHNLLRSYNNQNRFMKAESRRVGARGWGEGGMQS